MYKVGSRYWANILKMSNSSMVSLCVYSHSDYFDILKIQVDYIKTLNIPCDIYLFVNTPFILNGGKRTKYKSVKRQRGTRKRLRGGNNIKTILYDDTLPYYKRLSSCIEQVNSPHFILTHDNDILLQIDMDAIHKIVDLMKTNNIDAIKLSDDIKAKPEIAVKDTLYISKVRDDDTYAFNVQPRIWRKESALNLYLKFSEKTYHSSENGNVQEFTKTQKIYVLYDMNIIKSHYSSTKYYTFMHITRSSSIIQYNKKQNMNSIMTTEYAKIKDKYFKNTKRAFYP